MAKLNFMGIGPKIAAFTFPWLAVAIYLSVKFRSVFAFIGEGSRLLFYIGLALVILGALMYFSTAPLLMKGLRETRLMTGGSYYLCRNPLYSAIILFIIPGISLMMNSWLVLTTSLVAYICCKVFIKSEYTEMEHFFGDEYRKYRDTTPEFFPFPVKKWFNKT